MTDLSGRTLGKYQVTTRIGRGGMAEVYLGVHTHLDRKVAIKVMHGHLLEGGDFIARFKREARSVANLRHPNIVQVHDFDIEDEIIYMVMEYIDGTNLQKKLVELNRKKERLPIATVGSIINDIAEALDYAHSKGMLHRDVKPSNILLDNNDKAYLTDFGIAKILSDQKFTAPGTVIGTPAYMSPEQGMGKDLTRESDIYSLGVVAFELITGQLPYEAPTPIAIVQKQISEPVPDITKLVSDVPGAAQEVIETALAKSPKRRYSSAEAMVWAIRTALNALDPGEAADAGKTRVASSSVEEELPVTMVADLEAEGEKTTVGEKLEPAATAMAEPKQEEQPIPPTLIGSKPGRSMPTWGWIAAGIALVAIVTVIFSQIIGGKPAAAPVEPTQTTTQLQPTEVEEEVGGVEFDGNTVAFGKPKQPNGVDVFYQEGGDADVEYVFAQGAEAWRSGNGRVMPSSESNSIRDQYMIFNVDDSFLFSGSPTADVLVELEYLDEGDDRFWIEYDALSGGPYSDGTFKESQWVEKTNTGEFKTAVFELSDARFSNRIQGGDFRLNDDRDGAETIRSVRVSIPSIQSELTLDQVLAEGERLLNEGDSTGAVRLFDRALEQGVEDGFFLHLRSLALLESGEPEAAIGGWTQAIEQNPDNPEFWRERGFARLQLGDLGGALEDLNHAIERNPNDVGAYRGRAEVFLRQGNHRAAIQDAQRVLEFEPDDPGHYALLAEAYRSSRDPANFPLAMDTIHQGLAIFPRNSDLYRLKGQIHWFDMGEQAAAQEAFHLAVEYAEPGDSRPFTDRALYYLESGQCDLAVRDYSQAIEFDPGNPYLYFEQGECYRRMGEDELAREDFNVFMAMTEGKSEFIDLRLEIQSWLDG